MAKPTVLSLYTGAGGLDFGFEAAGFRTSVAVEMDEACCLTLRSNRKWPVIQSDIGAVSTEAILKKGNLLPGEVDVLIGGPPCQPFSKSGFWASGQTKRLNDPRASTVGAYMRVLEEARPRAFLLENVEGLGFRGKDEGILLIQEELSRINREHGTNYVASVRVLNSVDYGVPQMRKRMFIIGSREGKPFQFPAATHENPDEPETGHLKPHTTAWQAFRGLRPEIDEELLLKGKWADLLPSIPEGYNYLWHTERGGGEPLFGWRTRYWCFLLKLAKNKPSWTLQAQPGPATGPFHWKNRRLSWQEMARLQTFPDDVTVTGSLASQQKQIGNAVPSLMAEILAREIRTQLLSGTRLRARLKLAVQAEGLRPPRAEPVQAVPAMYHDLIGEHAPHPGTGSGPRALRRALGLPVG